MLTELHNNKVHYTQQLNNQRRELLEHSEKESAVLRADLDKARSDNATLTTTLTTNRKQFVITLNTENDKAKEREDELNKQIEQTQRDLQH